MKLKSEMLSNVLAIMLWVLIASSAIAFLCTIVYVIDVDLYVDYAYSLDGIVDIMSRVLYFSIIVLYLIWIYRVHMDLNVIMPNYPRSPGMALVCNMVPIYNFYGLPSTYSKMGKSLITISAARKQGYNIQGLAVYLIIFLLVSNGLNRAVLNAGTEVSSTLLILSGAANIVIYSVYLTLCIQVTRGLRNARIKEMPATSNPDKPDWVSTGFTNEIKG